MGGTTGEQKNRMVRAAVVTWLKTTRLAHMKPEETDQKAECFAMTGLVMPFCQNILVSQSTLGRFLRIRFVLNL